jgi:hypothetical protein
LFAGFSDNLHFLGPQDYAFAQITVSGIAGRFADGPSPSFAVSLDSAPLALVFDPFGPNPFTITTTMIPLTGNHLPLSLTVGASWSLPIFIPSGITNFSGQIDRIQLFDSGGNPISSATYSDESGTSYHVDGGVLVPEPVPEVSSVILLATLLAFSGGICWYRRRPAPVQ